LALASTASQAEEITACELLLSQQHGDVQLLDVRSQAEYDDGHIMGAKLIPLKQLEQRFKELDRNQSVVVYCYSGRRAAQAENLLQEHGFNSVHTLAGHWKDWDASLNLLSCKDSVTVAK
jgi:phage shock protein E